MQNALPLGRMGASLPRAVATCGCVHAQRSQWENFSPRAIAIDALGLEVIKVGRVMSADDFRRTMNERAQQLRARSARMLRMGKSLTLYVETDKETDRSSHDTWRRVEDRVYGDW
jgi:hypothetical protein